MCTHASKMDTCDVVETDVNIDYLHPELLSPAILIKILNERQIRKSGLKELDKEELLELFNQYILPLPQRVYGQGRREVRLNSSRNETQKRKLDNEDGSSKKLKIACNNSNINNKALTIENKLATLNCGSESHSSDKSARNQDYTLEDAKITDCDDLSPTKRKRQMITWP